MHPAFSVILFTTASGAGYGLLLWFALCSLAAPDWIDRPLALTTLLFGLALVSAGLGSSTLHLGRPERAWRALSQWRTSWLSREGVAAIAAYVPAGLLALAWIVWPRPGGVAILPALLMIPAALATTYCTAMIYASLKTVRQWRNRFTVPNYYALGLFTGALLFAAILRLFGRETVAVDIAVLVVGAATLALKLAYWRSIEGRGASTAESATGLGGFGTVRLFEAPHTEENYLMREMGFSIARKHAAKLRRLCLAALFGAPLLLTLIALLAGGWIAGFAAVLAVISAGAGVLVERWLFFAEATHVVTLFYGARAA
ncbi:dimethyl sulfoxide reductase anchor subunit family protein [Hansschlegelia zhihuaiae]|uniref:Dimethyl sulfoxide reductase anchor subunit n=1 Tax=Hansschlegelia zhihuaiae TaxID=405005 RepID=A0A4Q0MKU0_9HYPH|nr:DmsC/YnfH family molybdoenzyme membrane anchor subunit [Hansschlegelia zhihuaiae]RXF74264.1 dimethyl sulfoxide reductase anchor subunit [Hansschlegelia zhihuaiae]